MKKLIIIDTDDDKYTHAKVSLSYKDENGYWADVNYETYPLRELPLKRKNVVEWLYNYGTIRTHELTEYDKGWNDCVDFLENEE